MLFELDPIVILVLFSQFMVFGYDLEFVEKDIVGIVAIFIDE
jgi:hypothetical protein